MKKVLLAVAVLGLVASLVTAGTVNPTSNVLADTAATADTIVLRDSSGGIDGQQLTNLSISKARIASSAVSTTQLFIDLPQMRIACINTTKQLGFCNGSVNAGGLCNCSATIP